MHFFYIIYSKKLSKYYVGETNNPSERLKMHNSHAYPKAYTRIANDWAYVLIFDTKTKADAIFLERFVKRMKSRKFIEKLILDKSVLEDILNKK